MKNAFRWGIKERLFLHKPLILKRSLGSTVCPDSQGQDLFLGGKGPKSGSKSISPVLSLNLCIRSATHFKLGSKRARQSSVSVLAHEGQAFVRVVQGKRYYLDVKYPSQFASASLDTMKLRIGVEVADDPDSQEKLRDRRQSLLTCANENGVWYPYWNDDGNEQLQLTSSSEFWRVQQRECVLKTSISLPMVQSNLNLLLTPRVKN